MVRQRRIRCGLTAALLTATTAATTAQSSVEGTGTTVTWSGEIVTSNYVVAGATTITVTLNDTLRVYTATMTSADAAISSGDSGGPLVDASSDAIGMDTASASSSCATTTSAQVIGFAIPSATLETVITQLQRDATT